MTAQGDDDEDWLIGESEDGERKGGFPKVSCGEKAERDRWNVKGFEKISIFFHVNDE